MDPLKLIGDEVKRRRVASGLSQEDLASLSNLHRTYIGSVERGERNVSLQNIVSIAIALKCKPSHLFVGIDQEISNGTM
ncbi:helix-turn-helix domain-containing protein [Aeromonas caviae]|uniref:helix-turn-helix domain-containing protein n=1 Tax=Aeromonas caviae TaxID=648 RepID=UPI002B479C89|nr:helix-turn-helix transcriptional regulator [Aeromonas caviae]